MGLAVHVYQGGQQFAEFANPSIFQEVATDGRRVLLPKVVPFMSQMARAPELLPENVCLAVTVEIAFHGSRWRRHDFENAAASAGRKSGTIHAGA